MPLSHTRNKNSYSSFEKKLFFAFAFIVGVLILIFYFSKKSNKSLVETQKWVDHTKEVLYQSEKVNYLFKGIEAESRGFLITGWNEFNSNFIFDTTSIKSHIKQLKVLTADNLKQQRRIGALDSLISKRIIFARTLIVLRQEKGFEEAKKLVLSKEGVRLSNQIVIIIEALQADEKLLLQQRTLVNQKISRSVKIITILLQLVLFFVLLTVLVIVISTLRQREKIEKELSESESWFSKTLEGISDGIVATDNKGIVNFINPIAENLTGWRLQDALGKPVSEIFNVINEHTGEVQENPIHKTLKDRQSTNTSHNTVLIRKDKNAIAIDESAAPIFNSEQTLIGAVLVFRDAEKQRNAAKVLEQKVIERTAEVIKGEKRYRETLDNMMEGVQIMDRSWKYLYVNDALVKQGKYSREEFLGHTVMELYPGIEQSELFKDLELCMNERKHFHFETEFTFPDNTVSFFELSIQPVPEGIFILSIDISERKKAEASLKALNINLEKKVKERTIQLEQANVELESFSYSVSHDLRAPLRAINGYSTILTEDYAGKLDDEGKRLLGVIRDNVSKMGQLINDLLEFAKMAKQNIKESRIEMEILIKSVVQEQTALHPNKKIEIIYKDLKNINADESMMRQVLTNLLSNAIKYSSKKENIFIEIGSRQTSDNQIEYYIKDNGAGFNMNYYDKLFGVFQRLHSPNDFEGTGVGLALVQRIIARHQGKVWAEGKENEGATFYFSIPDTI